MGFKKCEICGASNKKNKDITVFDVSKRKRNRLDFNFLCENHFMEDDFDVNADGKKRSDFIFCLLII